MMALENHTRIGTICLLICVLAASCTGNGEPVATETRLPVSSTPLTTETPVSTSTQTPTDTPVPSPTIVLTPTSVQAKFINRPAYLKEIFTGDYWNTNSEGSLTMMAVELPLETTAPNRYILAFNPDPETSNFIIIRTDLDLDLDPETRAGLEVRLQSLYDSILDKFLPAPAREKLWKFIEAHPEPGSYQSRIDGFEVKLTVEDDFEDNQSQILLQIIETAE